MVYLLLPSLWEDSPDGQQKSKVGKVDKDSAGRELLLMSPQRGGMLLDYSVSFESEL